MKNITLAIDEAVLDDVRVYAAKNQTTVNGLVRDYLTKLASEETRLDETRARLKELMENSGGQMGPDFVWDREKLYEDRMFPRHRRAGVRRNGKAK
jgi:Family of unknown function (DUF6364)